MNDSILVLFHYKEITVQEIGGFIGSLLFLVGREVCPNILGLTIIKVHVFRISTQFTDSEITVSCYYIERMALITWISEGRC